MRLRLHIGTATALFVLLGGTLSVSADYSVFKIQNQATDGCIIFQPADTFPGSLWTRGCNSAGENIVSIENNVSYFKLLFHVGVFGNERCINVRSTDTIPADINANECESGTSLWASHPFGSGIVRFHLRAVANPDSHCLAANPTTTRIQIAHCANTPEQMWRKRSPL